MSLRRTGPALGEPQPVLKTHVHTVTMPNRYCARTARRQDDVAVCGVSRNNQCTRCQGGHDRGIQTMCKASLRSQGHTYKICPLAGGKLNAFSHPVCVRSRPVRSHSNGPNLGLRGQQVYQRRTTRAVPILV